MTPWCSSKTGRGRGVWSFGLAQIDKIETTAGETGRSGNAMKKGALIGGVLGLATGIIFANTFDPSSDNRKYSRMQTGIVTGIAGAGFGFFIGSLVSTERWVSVPAHVERVHEPPDNRRRLQDRTRPLAQVTAGLAG